MWVVWVNVSITTKVLIASVFFQLKLNLNYSENKCKHHYING